jgi:hypothetical protein
MVTVVPKTPRPEFDLVVVMGELDINGRGCVSLFLVDLPPDPEDDANCNCGESEVGERNSPPVAGHTIRVFPNKRSIERLGPIHQALGFLHRRVPHYSRSAQRSIVAGFHIGPMPSTRSGLGNFLRGTSARLAGG